MAYDRNELFNTAMDLIDRYKFVFVDEVINMMPCRRSTFYLHFPADSEKMDIIKEALNKNKISLKANMRKKWYDSDNATLQVGLYKLIATPEERKALSQTYHDHTSNDEQLPSVNFIPASKADE